jgi:hypothetical protein
LAAECLKRIFDRSGGGRQCEDTSDRSNFTASRVTRPAANVKGRLFFTGPTTVGNFDSDAREFDTQEFLTPEELDSLVEFAVTRPAPNIPAAHLTSLIVLGYVAVTAKGLVVAGDGIMRIMESE